jgi:ADP-ribosylglycohydrolase
MSIVPKGNNLEVDLIDYEYSWESIIFFGCLHIGDSDSTGAILGAWYGAINGYNGFDKNKMLDLEFYNELNIIIMDLQK